MEYADRAKHWAAIISRLFPTDYPVLAADVHGDLGAVNEIVEIEEEDAAEEDGSDSDASDLTEHGVGGGETILVPRSQPKKRSGPPTQQQPKQPNWTSINQADNIKEQATSAADDQAKESQANNWDGGKTDWDAPISQEPAPWETPADAAQPSESGDGNGAWSEAKGPGLDFSNGGGW